jgi:pathogenesis-related protein 1
LLLAFAAPAANISQEMVAAHNAVRSRVNVPPLSWSDKLAAAAQQWAGTLIARKQFEHNPKSPYGENLFEIEGANAKPADVVNDWASEAKDYDYATNKCRKVCGHYTQVIWRDTKEVGCGVARGGNREVWVCEYNPPGNFTGQKPY